LRICQRQLVVGRELELVAVELGVGGDDDQRVARVPGVGVGVLGQVVLRTDQAARVRRRARGSVVEAQVGLVQCDRVGDDDAVQVLVVLPPVSGGQRGRVDGGLLVTPVDVTATGVDGQ